MNPLLTKKPSISPQALNGVKSCMNMLKMANNPENALNLMVQQNPQLNDILEACKGRNPKDVFIERCNQLGYNPEDVIKLLM